ncbi:hypothetical protein AAG565_10135 [Fontimonas sp. SYSU GA230001]|uniref:hypothetical protein n=1 Tax=Fontimonas sp. SYSU GA230001 TaxID=3142450 RepID=UPI0032B4E7C0
MLRSLRPFFVALFLLPLAALAQDNVSRGTIGEMGYGKFVLKEGGGLERLYLVGKKDTNYEPDDWRPGEGDQVQVTFFEKKGKLVASSVKLVKLGPNSVDPKQMVSPMRVKVVESGKSGVIATLKGSSKKARFVYARKRTEFDPVGWVPQVGEEVEVEFEVEPSTFKYDMSYVLLKIKRIR